MPSLSDHVAAFAHHVVAQHQAIGRGDSRTGNRHAKKGIVAARALLAAGDPGIEAFSQLFNHEDPSVRAGAAAYLLKSRTDRAVAVLRPIANGLGLPALGAQMTLARYERGELEIT